MSTITEAVQQLTDERVGLSEVKLFIENLLSEGISKRPETTLAQRSVEKSFMWLGMAKGAVGSTNPYPQSTKQNLVIEPGQDRVTVLNDALSAILNQDGDKKEKEILCVKHGRELLGVLVKAIRNDLTILTNNQEYQDSVKLGWQYAQEAKMYLGLVLGLIRDENPKKFPTSADLAKQETDKPTAEDIAKQEAADRKNEENLLEVMNVLLNNTQKEIESGNFEKALEYAKECKSNLKNFKLLDVTDIKQRISDAETAAKGALKAKKDAQKEAEKAAKKAEKDAKKAGKAAEGTNEGGGQ